VQAIEEMGASKKKTLPIKWKLPVKIW